MRRTRHIFIDGAEHKWCGSCKKWKELYDFSVNRNKAFWDGVNSCCKECGKEYHTKNRESILRKKKEYRESHRREITQKAVEYKRNRRRSDAGYKARHNLSRRICYAINGRDKSATTMELLGCSVGHLKAYLESAFTERMSWDNYGSYWHIDHIKPCAFFDLSDPEQQKECFRYTNLRPVEKTENLSKGSKYNGVLYRRAR